MTLEELQAMTDEQLNELAAIQVMGWAKWNIYNANIQGVFRGDTETAEAFNPAGDMNNATELMNKFHVSELKWDRKFGYVSIIEGNTVFSKYTPPRAITIAAILAKGE